MSTAVNVDLNTAELAAALRVDSIRSSTSAGSGLAGIVAMQDARCTGRLSRHSTPTTARRPSRRTREFPAARPHTP
jgi:hypothetical protein